MESTNGSEHPRQRGWRSRRSRLSQTRLQPESVVTIRSIRKKNRAFNLNFVFFEKKLLLFVSHEKCLRILIHYSRRDPGIGFFLLLPIETFLTLCVAAKKNIS